jgi:transmembrane sensor
VLIETAQGGDPRARPFILQTAAGSVRPVWTRFSARERGDIVRVSVYRGVVTVEPMANAAGAELVAAGRMTRFSATRVEPPRPLPDQSAAWTRGVLLADGMRLGHFLDELSRYHAGYLTYAPEVAQLRLVGSYPLTDPNRVLKALEASLPVRVRRFTPWWIRVEPR